jgi:tetratricopeptide (TPR) repeat protein
MSSSLPETIGKFHILQAIGEGGMGRLFLGRDPDLGSLVAIKLLREGFDNAELRERFTREARAARGLRHGNIVTIFEAGTHMGQPFIVMEFIQGETLAQLIHGRAALPLERKLQLMDELAAGLEHAHRKGVVHRDVKPANLMIDEDGVLRILDFGIARHGTTGAITQQGAVIGTYNYMAPEQLAGEVVDGRADLFAAGAVFYELLAYRRAFPGEPPAILRRIFLDNPEPLEHVCPGLDPHVISIVNRCLAKQPNERYVDFSAFRSALAAARHQLTIQDTGAGAVGFEDLLRIRTEQIAQHLGTARQACDTANYSVALQACQRVLLLEPQHAEARELTERARSGLERRKLVRQCLQEASTELDRGAVTAASALVNRALAIDPRSEDAATLRRTVDEAIRLRSNETQQIADTQLLRSDDAPVPVPASTVRTEPTTRHTEPLQARSEDRVLQPKAIPAAPAAPRPVLQEPIGYASPVTRWRALLQTRPGMAIAAVVVVLLVMLVWRARNSSDTRGGVADAPIASPPASAGPPPPAAAAPSAPAPPAVATQSPVPPLQAQPPPAVTAPEAPAAAGAQDLNALHASARTQWQRGDSTAALATLAAALKLQPRNSQTRAIVDEFVSQANAQSSSAEQLARDAGAGETAKFGTATARAREAERLARSGQTSAAIRAYLDTVTIFAEAANEPKAAKAAQQPPPPVVEPTPAPPAPAITKVSIRSPYPVLLTVGGQSHSAATLHELTLPAGPQTIELNAPQVFMRRTLNIDGRAGTTHSEVLPSTVNVRFAAIPANARLTINGYYAGALPATIPVAIGPATLEFAWLDNRQQRLTVSIASEGQTIFGEAPKK